MLCCHIISRPTLKRYMRDVRRGTAYFGSCWKARGRGGGDVREECGWRDGLVYWHVKDATRIIFFPSVHLTFSDTRWLCRATANRKRKGQRVPCRINPSMSPRHPPRFRFPAPIPAYSFITCSVCSCNASAEVRKYLRPCIVICPSPPFAHLLFFFFSFISADRVISFGHQLASLHLSTHPHIYTDLSSLSSSAPITESSTNKPSRPPFPPPAAKPILCIERKGEERKKQQRNKGEGKQRA